MQTREAGGFGRIRNAPGRGPRTRRLPGRVGAFDRTGYGGHTSNTSMRVSPRQKKGLFHFEHRSNAVLPWPLFLQRLLRSGMAGAALVLVSLLAGIAGYHLFEGLGFVDAFENAAMLLSGMGPLWQPQTTAGKIFAGTYALYSGLAVIVITGIAFAPVIHRFFHRLHVDDSERDPD